MAHSKKSKPAPKAHPAKPAKHAPAKHAPAKPEPKKHAPAKPAETKHHAKHAAPAKHAPEKHHPEKHAADKHAPEKHAAEKHAPAAKAPAPKPAAPAKGPATPAKAPAAGKADGKAASKADALRARILERRSAKPIAFTLDEVREIAKTNDGKPGAGAEGKAGNGKVRTHAEEIEAKLKKAAQPHHVKAASLADILGYNPAKQQAPTVLDPSAIDPKYQRYYKLLIELREHVVSGLNTHTEETLKRSAKDDSGDLSGYGQHMADAGTDTFDRDFALSLVSSEQEALSEIEAAILRIRNGSYGVCELTGKPISKERLLAVPFARYSVESQAEVERTRRRSSSRGGLFGEGGEEGGKIEDDGGGDE